MKNLVNIIVCLMLVMLLSTAVTASDCGLVAKWKFENLNEEKVIRPFEE